MNNLKLRDKFKNIANIILKRNKELLDVIEKRPISNEHGFQLTKDDYSQYLKRFLPKEISNQRLRKLNTKGYLSEEIGLTLKSLIDDNEHDTYIKNVHSNYVDSIMEEGIRCLGTSFSLSTTNPDTIDKVSLDNTITKVDDLTVIVEHVKGNNGINVAGNEVNGTMILKIPKGISKEDILYYNSDSKTFNIHPNYIVGFLPVDKNHKVGNWVLPNLKNYENKAI